MIKNCLASTGRAITKFWARLVRLSKKWRLHAIIYFLVLLLGLGIITFRQKAQYAAAYDLKAGHEIKAADLKAQDPGILKMFQPDPNLIVGMYLKTNVGANTPIWTRNVTATPPVTVEGKVLQVRLTGDAVIEKFRQTGSKVILSSPDSTEKHEGVIISVPGKPETDTSKSEAKATPAGQHLPDR